MANVYGVQDTRVVEENEWRLEKQRAGVLKEVWQWREKGR
jgi:hypothetical protein